MTEDINHSEELQQNVEDVRVTDESPNFENPENAENVVSEERVENVETTENGETNESPENIEFVDETQTLDAKKQEKEEFTEVDKPKKYSFETQNSVIPNTDDFNWEELGKDKQQYSLEEHKQMEDVYNQTFSAITEQEVVMGTIVAKNAREVVVNIGFKSDGIIPANELRYSDGLNIGDKIDVYVESQEDAAGQLLLSHKKARMLKSWERVITAHDTEEIITGYVKSKTKGGLIVDVFGVEAFLPGSQIDVKPIRDYDIFVDKTMEFKVVKINHEYKNIVVSHKALIESELEAQRMEIMSGLEKGQVLEGIVKNITNYGAFIDLGGVDGLIHITDLSWGRISDPKEIIELDQKINVVILDFDESKKRIALGLKQLTPHPWDAFDPDLKEGDKVHGKVVVIADYGAFIEVMPGVEGLIHVSEMSWSQHLRTAQDFLKVGDTVDAVILTLDRDERKMSLGIKQLIPDPWITIANRYPAESRHTAIVRNFTNFGIFVELEEGVDGLIHISDLSWSKRIKHPAEFTRIGETMDVVVLEIDGENRRLSLGHKQLEDNPWEIFETIYTIGSVHQGTVSGQSNEKGWVVHLQGVEGFAFNRGLQREDGTTIRTGETEEFKVLEFSKEIKRIVLSHSKIWQDIRDAERDAREEHERKNAKEGSRVAKRISDNLERSTLGDLDALISLKADLEMAENKSKKTPQKPKKAKTNKVKNLFGTEIIEETPIEETLIAEMPIAEMSAIEFPTAEIPFEEILTEEIPTEEVPTEEVPTEEIPTKEIPTEEVPTEEVPTEEVPTEEVPTEEIPTEEVPTEEVPTEEVPTEEVPTEEVPTEEVPTEEVPTEEVPTEEVPTEEVPKKTRAKKTIKEETPAVESAVELSEEKPKKTRAKKAVKEDESTAAAPAAEPSEEKPKKTRAKKTVKEDESTATEPVAELSEEKPKKTRAKKATKAESY